MKYVPSAFETSETSSFRKVMPCHYVVRCVLNYLVTKGVRLFPWPSRAPDLPIGIFLWVYERLGGNCSSATTTDDVWDRLEAT
ncbi:hypothetical protein TNCV_2422691 [Trichonephila clavipes]|nr:hypothetical protein TNCV_2422691 [Trichonephila clavipes]